MNLKIIDMLKSAVADFVSVFRNRIRNIAGSAIPKVKLWYGSTRSWMIKHNEGLFAVAGTGIAAGVAWEGLTAAQSAFSHLFHNMQETQDVRESAGESVLRRERRDVHSKAASVLIKMLDINSEDEINPVIAYKHAIDLSVAICEAVMGTNNPMLIEAFMNLMMYNLSLMSVGYKLDYPEDHQHLRAFIEESLDSQLYHSTVKDMMIQLALTVAAHPEIAIDPV